MDKTKFSKNELLEMESLEIRGGSSETVVVTQDGCINEAAGCGVGVAQSQCVNRVLGCGSKIVISNNCDD